MSSDFNIKKYPQSIYAEDGKEMMLVSNLKKMQKVLFPHMYYMDKYPVTCEEYIKFCDSTGYTYPSHILKHSLNEEQRNSPVVQVNVKDIQAYAKWANKEIPTAGEWCLAAGSYRQNYSIGKQLSRDNCNILFKVNEDSEIMSVASEIRSQYANRIVSDLQQNKTVFYPGKPICDILKMSEEQILNSNKTIFGRPIKSMRNKPKTLEEQFMYIVRRKLPDLDYDIDMKEFKEILAGSISLLFDEKLEVIRQLPDLGNMKVKRLLEIFVDERNNFMKILEDHESNSNVRLGFFSDVEMVILYGLKPVDYYEDNFSPFGIWDMSGNVYEWTCTSNCDISKSLFKVKGGSFLSAEPEIDCLLSSYKYVNGENKLLDLGFRCVRRIAG